MAKVKSMPAVRRTGFVLNDASPFTHAECNTSAYFDIKDDWETEIETDYDRLEFKLNNCDTLSEKSSSELSQDKRVLYYSTDLNSNNASNRHLLTRKTGGFLGNSKSSLNEIELDGTDSMAPITNACYTSNSIDVFLCDIANNDLKLRSAETPLNVKGLLPETDYNDESNSVSNHRVDSASLSSINSDVVSNLMSPDDDENNLLNNELLALIKDDAAQRKNLKPVNGESGLFDIFSEERNDLIDSETLSTAKDVNVSSLSCLSNLGLVTCKSKIDFEVPVAIKDVNNLSPLLNSSIVVSSDLNAKPSSSELDLVDLLLEDKSSSYVSKTAVVTNDPDDLTSLLNLSDVLPSNAASVSLDVESSLVDSLLMKESELPVSVKVVDELSPSEDSSFLETSNLDSFLHNVKLDFEAPSISKGDNDLSSLLDSSLVLPSNLDFKPFNGELDLSDLLAEGKNSSYISENEVVGNNADNLLELRDSSMVLLPNLDSTLLNNKKDLFDSLLSEESSSRFSESPVLVKDIDNISPSEKSSVAVVSDKKSLANLAGTHFFSNEPSNNVTNILNFKNEFDLFSFDICKSNGLEESSKFDHSTVERYLIKSDNETIKIETSDNKHQSKVNLTANEVSEDEIEPDIDLNFCVRSPVAKVNYFSESSNSESKDSGFDETDFETIQSVIPSVRTLISGKKQVHESFLRKKTPSILSIAISCKLNLENSRREKLKSIRKKLLGVPAFTDFNLQNIHIMENSKSTVAKNICNSEENVTDHPEEFKEFRNSNHMIFLGQ